MTRQKKEKRRETTCAQCGRLFMGVIRFRQRFCSVQCVSASRRVEGAKWRSPEYIKEYQRSYQAKNRERINRASVEWCTKNREKRLASSRNYALKRRAKIAAEKRPATPSQIQSVLKKAEGRCVYCGRYGAKLTIDHVEPLARGGRHIVSNLVAACQACNSSKGAGDGPEWAYDRFGLWGTGRVISFLERKKIDLRLYPEIDTPLSRWKRKHVAAQYGVEVEVVR